MNADRTPALRTVPLYLFILNKLSNPHRFNFFQVLDLAHVVFRTVAIIEMFQPLTGKTGAVKTKPGFAVLKMLAILYAATHSGGGLVHVGQAAAMAGIGFSQISQANAAIHPTGGNKLGFS